MNSLCEIEKTHQLVNHAIKVLEERRGENADPFSEGNLAYYLGKKENNAGKSALLAIGMHFYDNCISYKKEGDEHIISKTHTVKGANKFDWWNDLKEKILFLDEALPHSRGEEDIQILRFLRNLGCTFGMQVIAAGTASVVANMIKQNSDGNEASRDEINETSMWMACHFHWMPITEEDLNDMFLLKEMKGFLATHEKTDFEKLLKMMLLEGRPWVAHRFTKADRELFLKRLGKVGAEIMDSKKPSAGAKLSWLMGSWLDQERLTTSPFPIKPPRLVSQHFFEPAVQMQSDTGAPYLDKGIARTKNKPGPLTLRIFRIAPQDLEKKSSAPKGVWGLSSESATSLSIHFAEIASSLCACVQQCLAREPLLALAISEEHRCSGKDEFHTWLRSIEESTMEYNLRAMSGEQIEATVYAALQQANGCELSSRRDLRPFCLSLVDFLEPKPNERINVDAAAMNNWGIPQIYMKTKSHVVLNNEGAAAAKKAAAAVQDKKTAEIPKVLDLSEEIAKTIKMPWLVPAASKARPTWSEGAKESALKVLSDLDVAGLIPSGTNARCDFEAYKWPFTGEEDPLWKFEVKSRSNSYPMSKGVEDLVRKCQDGDDTVGRYHAMLIAIRGQERSEVQMWGIEKGGKVYARVLVLVAA